MSAATTLGRDSDLITAVIAGNSQAMHELYGVHHRRIYGMALRLTGNVSDAEDVVQETFIRAWRNLSRFRGESGFGTWLGRIAINLCRDLARKRKPTADEADPASPTSTDDIIARKHLEAALAALPRGYREVVVLHDVLELGHAEIAEMLGTSVGTSKSQLHKARAKLRKTLSRVGGHP